MADDVNEKDLLSCGWEVSSLLDAPSAGEERKQSWSSGIELFHGTCDISAWDAFYLAVFRRLLLDLNDRAPGDWEASWRPPSLLCSHFWHHLPVLLLPFPALLVNEWNGKNLLIFQNV